MRSEKEVRERYDMYLELIQECAQGCGKKSLGLRCWACELASQQLSCLRWVLELDLRGEEAAT